MSPRSNGRGSRRRRTGVPLRAKGNEFFKLFARAGANLQTTGELVHQLLVSWPDQPALRDQITRCEQEGDRLTRQIIQRLHQRRAAPFDRRDVHALAEAIDDVVDEIEEVSEEMAVYDIDAPMDRAQELAAVVRDSGRAVRRALDILPHAGDLSDEARQVRELEHEGGPRLSRGDRLSLRRPDRPDGDPAVEGHLPGIGGRRGPLPLADGHARGPHREPCLAATVHRSFTRAEPAG